MLTRKIFVGCAGWSIPREEKGHFPENGTHLERYATQFSAVEINSSFYRPHRSSTYARWAASVPENFRFAVKIPKTITHLARLKDTQSLLAKFLDEVAGLEAKLGCLLIQLPPSLEFEPSIAQKFFESLRLETRIPAAFEPRHATWFSAPAERQLKDFEIARVAADPPPVPAAPQPGGWNGITYHRLHGSPRIYYSTYSKAFIEDLGLKLIAGPSMAKTSWYIFDNTALAAAMPNARQLLNQLKMKR